MAKETKTTKSQSAPKKKIEKKAQAAPAVKPLIDPLQSASAAAAMVGRGIVMPPSGSGPKTESTSFKNLKDSLTKPHSQTIGGVLDKIAPNNPKFGGGIAGMGKQVGHNQTVGADVARRNVPRRTNG